MTDTNHITTIAVKDEIWVPVRGFDRYEVSNKGRVRSKQRIVICKHTDACKSSNKNVALKYLKNQKARGGYASVQLYIDSKTYKNRLVHRIVADNFLDNPLNLETVNHLDFNKLNNFVENLEWSGRKENFEHAMLNDKIAKGSDCKHAKLCERCVVAILHLIQSGMPQKVIADMFQVHRDAILSIKIGRTWSHLKIEDE